MKAVRVCIAVLLLMVSLSGCTLSQPSSGYSLYFCTSSVHGPALASQPYYGSSNPSVEELVDALFQGPDTNELTSPFPRGLTLQDWTLKDGLLTLNLSEQYSGLADVSLTLADYCLVLTLSQLDGVEAVQIQASGHTYHSRSHQIMSLKEALLEQEFGDPSSGDFS